MATAAPPPWTEIPLWEKKTGSLDEWACVDKNLVGEASRREGKSDFRCDQVRSTFQQAPVQFMPWFSFLNLTQRAATKTPYGCSRWDGLQAEDRNKTEEKHICAIWRPRRTEQHTE
jgi:hypothetical protein